MFPIFFHFAFAKYTEAIFIVFRNVKRTWVNQMCRYCITRALPADLTCFAPSRRFGLRSAKAVGGGAIDAG